MAGVNDALVTSLCERVRALEDILDGIDAREQRTTALAVSVQQRVEQNEKRIQGLARLAAIVQPEDEAVEAGAPRHARPKRDRHGLTLIPGGLAALAPVAFLCHSGLLTVTFAALRAWLKTEFGRWAAAAVLFGVAGATAAGTVAAVDVQAGTPPHPHAIIRVHHHRKRHWQQQNPPPLPARPPLAVHHASRHHQRPRADDDATPTPGPSPTDTETPTPAPSATATGTGIPSPGATGTPPGG